MDLWSCTLSSQDCNVQGKTFAAVMFDTDHAVRGSGSRLRCYLLFCVNINISLDLGTIT